MLLDQFFGNPCRQSYRYAPDTHRIRIHDVSAYSNLNEPETKGYVSLPSIRPGPNFFMEVGEEPRGSPAEGHGLAVEEGRGGAPRLLAHPAAFFSSRSGTSAEGAAGRKTEEGAPAAMAELAIFLHTSLALPAE